MSFINSVSENIILPISDLITGQSIYKHLQFLNKSQFWTRDQIDNYQNEKLRQIINHAYTNVQFYRELFSDLRLRPEEIQTKKDLDKLPIITKEDLKKNKNKLLAKNIDRKTLLLSSSSGSTGEPFQYYSTKHSKAFLKAAAIRTWYWMGYRLGDKYVKISMNPRSSLIKKIQDKMNNCLYLSSKQIIPAEFKRIEKELQSYNPLFLRCYPVPLQFLAQQIKNTRGSFKNNSLIAINTTGSTLHENVRREIEQVFNVKIFDSYSCEGGTIFAECPSHEFYHPAEEYAISEFISDKYTLSEAEKPVRHITTDLHNYASPFIRYDTQDYVVLGNQKPCSCGRTFLNVKKIKGRDSDILITPSGKYLIVENFVAYFEWIKEVEQIQVIQDKLDSITINMVVNNMFTNNIMVRIKDYWVNYIGNDVNLELNLVKDIKLTPAGKRRTLIRNSEIKIPAIDG
jgi:phenylacetate-CoA ligase